MSSRHLASHQYQAAALVLMLAAAMAGAAHAFAAPVAPAAAGETFDVLHFIIDGNTVLASAVIEQCVYPYMGPGRSLADVEGARAALQAAYHAAGYQTVLVDIPEQQVQAGVVHLLATEGRIERVKVSGSRYFSLGRILAEVPSLSEGQVPQMPAVQRELAQVAAATPDRAVRPIMRAGSTPGTVEVELRVTDELPLHGSVEVNNRNSVGTSATRVIGTLRYDNLWQRYHSASLQYQTAPEKQDVEVWAGTYVMPLFDSPWRLALYGIGIDSDSPVNSAGALSVVGTGNIFGARLVRPLAPLDNYSHSLSLGVDYKDFQQSIALVGADDQDTPISYLPFAVHYDGNWRHGDSAVTSVGLEANFSLRGVGNDQQEFEDKRFLARANYFYVGLDVGHQQILPQDVRLFAHVVAQLADSPLISNEQFAAGGVESVRGYHETEALGDDGATLSLELHSPRLWSWTDGSVLRALGFVEGGRLWIKDALPDTASRLDLASAGLGLQVAGGKALMATLDWAYPLLALESISAGEQRVHFKVAYEF